MIGEIDPAQVGTDAVVLDVRESDEWEAGHIAGSMHVPLQQVPGQLDALQDLLADTQLVVVCRVGARSASAVAWLATQGVEAVNLAGGLLTWADAGRPLVRSDGSPGRVD